MVEAREEAEHGATIVSLQFCRSERLHELNPGQHESQFYKARRVLQFNRKPSELPESGPFRTTAGWLNAMHHK
jgi:hypothetical protein